MRRHKEIVKVIVDNANEVLRSVELNEHLYSCVEEFEIPVAGGGKVNLVIFGLLGDGNDGVAIPIAMEIKGTISSMSELISVVIPQLRKYSKLFPLTVLAVENIHESHKEVLKELGIGLVLVKDNSVIVETEPRPKRGISVSLLPYQSRIQAIAAAYLAVKKLFSEVEEHSTWVGFNKDNVQFSVWFDGAGVVLSYSPFRESESKRLIAHLESFLSSRGLRELAEVFLHVELVKQEPKSYLWLYREKLSPRTLKVARMVLERRRNVKPFARGWSVPTYLFLQGFGVM